MKDPNEQYDTENNLDDLAITLFEMANEFGDQLASDSTFSSNEPFFPTLFSMTPEGNSTMHGIAFMGMVADEAMIRGRAIQITQEASEDVFAVAMVSEGAVNGDDAIFVSVHIRGDEMASNSFRRFKRRSFKRPPIIEEETTFMPHIENFFAAELAPAVS
jgi:hypothetical protein